MSRPILTGLAWFPFEVGTFAHMGVRKLRVKYGPLGEIVYIRLLTHIYQNGYFIKENLKDIAFAICEEVGSKWAKPEKILDIILYCFEVELFANIFVDDEVMTSKDIQENFVLATRKRKVKPEKYCLLSNENIKDLQKEGDILTPATPVVDQINPVNDPINPVNDPITQREKRRPQPQNPRPDINLIPERDNDQTKSLSEKTIKTLEDFKKAFKKVKINVSTIPTFVNFNELITAYSESPQFLQDLPFSFAINHYDKVISGSYKLAGGNGADINQKSTKVIAREYTAAELSGLFDDLDQVDI